jgi:hypothetical protein
LDGIVVLRSALDTRLQLDQPPVDNLELGKLAVQLVPTDVYTGGFTQVGFFAKSRDRV